MEAPDRLAGVLAYFIEMLTRRLTRRPVEIDVSEGVRLGMPQFIRRSPMVS